MLIASEAIRYAVTPDVTRNVPVLVSKVLVPTNALAVESPGTSRLVLAVAALFAFVPPLAIGRIPVMFVPQMLSRHYLRSLRGVM